MKVVICGVGSIGSSLIHFLSFHYNIVVIDTDIRALERIASLYDVQTLYGSASDPDILSQINCDAYTHVIGVTQSDEINLVACHLSRMFGPTGTTIARLERPSYVQGSTQYSVHGSSNGTVGKKLSQHFGVDMVFSSHDFAAVGMMQGLDHAYGFDALDLADGALILLGMCVGADHPWVGKTVQSIQEDPAFSVSVARIISNNRAWIPDKNQSISGGDALYLVIDRQHVQHIKDLWGWKDGAATSVVFLGSSPVLFAALPRVVSRVGQVSVVSDREEDLLRVSQAFPSVRLFQGSGMDPDLVRSAVEKKCCAIAVKDNDSQNMTMALMAQHYGAGQSMAFIQNLQYMTPLWMDSVGQMVHSGPRILMHIIQKIHQQKMVVYPLQGLSSGAILETVVRSGCKMDGMVCADWQEDRWHILAAYRDNTWIWNPESMCAGDRVILTALPDGYDSVQHVLATHGSGAF